MQDAGVVRSRGMRMLDGRRWLLGAAVLALVGYAGWYGTLHVDIREGRSRLVRRVAIGQSLADADSALTFGDADGAARAVASIDEAATRLAAEDGRIDNTDVTAAVARARESLAAGEPDRANVWIHHALGSLRVGTGELSTQLGSAIDATRSAALGGAVFGVLNIGALAWALWALRANEAWRRRWELSSQVTADGLWEWDISSGRVDYSARWRELFGADGDSLQTWLGRVHEDDLGELRTALDRHVAGGSPTFENEHRLRDRADRWRWILVRGLAERVDGKATRMVVWQTDITDRRVGADSAERTALLGHVADATGMAVFAVGDDDSLVQRNVAADALGRAWGGAENLWRRLVAVEPPTLGECPECGQSHRVGARVVELVTPAGARRICQVTWTGHGHRLVRDQLVTVVLVADITLRALAEEGARVAHQRLVASDVELRATFDAVPAVMFVVREGRVLLANRTARDAFGDAPEAVAPLMEALGAAGGSGPKVSAVLGGAREDVSYEVFRPVPIKFQGADAELLVANDVTGRVRAESELRTAERMVALGGLAAGLAHEINNPLTYVIGNLELAQEGVGEIGERVSRALGGAVRVRQIVAQLRTLANQGQGELGPVQMAEVVDGAVDIAAGLGLGSIEITRDVSPSLRVHANAVWLGQIVLNLVTNALYAMQGRPERTRHLHLSAVTETSRVRLEVTDNGGGVPELLRERIFEPFVSTRMRSEGSGLGLYICRELARRMDAELRLAWTGAEGSSFHLCMPLSGPVVAPLPPPPPPPSLPSVLVVDDDPQLAALLAETFRPARVRVESDLAGARAALAEGSYAAVVLDIALPDGSGIGLYDELHDAGHPAASSVVFVSGGSMTPDVARFVLHTSCPVVLKPFDLREFKELVERRVADAEGPA